MDDDIHEMFDRMFNLPAMKRLFDGIPELMEKLEQNQQDLQALEKMWNLPDSEN